MLIPVASVSSCLSMQIGLGRSEQMNKFVSRFCLRWFDVSSKQQPRQEAGFFGGAAFDAVPRDELVDAGRA